MDTLRPRLQLFTDEQVEQVLSDAIAVLATVGVEVENSDGRMLLREAGIDRA